jgi:lysine-ketoglutarate reductase/saccharopine dehydrogenase-like protein (TIGR00300 family)
MKERKPFVLPAYTPPDFMQPALVRAPLVTLEPVSQAGVAPDGYHATSIFPEYFHLRPGEWTPVSESRMDCTVVLERDGGLSVKEFRHLQVGDPVVCGRREGGEDGILVHAKGFEFPERFREKFAFRARLTRETSFSTDYDELYTLLEHERQKGFILWVLGPALVFDRDGREAFVKLVEGGYAHALHAGNALATHDLEAAFFGTALGQDIYSKRHVHLGHYKHLDTINKVRGVGSIVAAVKKGLVRDGIMAAVVKRGIPYVLAGSIRDDGPLPEVIGDAYQAQDRMRALARRATTVVALATQLHAIAIGNMLPSYQIGDGGVRPVYFYSVDMSEFAASKLSDRGSLTARSILTNVQDFVVTVERGLKEQNRSL